MGPNSDHRGQDLEVSATELRNTVTPIIGYLDLILESDREALSETQLGWVEVIERRAEVLEGLSRDLRALCAELRDPGPPFSGPPGAQPPAHAGRGD
jgi:signal transduction histidine kinase